MQSIGVGYVKLVHMFKYPYSRLHSTTHTLGVTLGIQKEEETPNCIRVHNYLPIRAHTCMPVSIHTVTVTNALHAPRQKDVTKSAHASLPHGLASG